MSICRVVAITGCDSGLGWAIAARSAREGLITVAGMFNGPDTPAAKALAKLNAHPCPLDVTSPTSVTSFGEFVRKLLNENPTYRLYAIVNNAGVMTIGDFEWNTQSIYENLIQVNLMGTLRVTSNFLPDLRRSAKEGIMRPRIINIVSHCGLQPLPGFAAYGASKAGVLSMTKSLHIEQQPYGVSSVAFIPGGFVGQSNIMSQQSKDGQTMLENLDQEQTAVYGTRLTSLINYLNAGRNKVPFDAVKDTTIIETFAKALTDDKPKQMYKIEPWRYKLYHTLFKLNLPEIIHNWLTRKFLSFPI